MLELLILLIRGKKMNNQDGSNHEMNSPLDSIQLQTERLDFSINKFQNENHWELTSDINEKALFEKVKKFELSKDVTKFVEDYDRVFGERNKFEWKWLGAVFKESGVTLSTIDKRYIDSITDCKILFCLLYIMVDDIAEVHKDEKTLQKMLEILRNDTNNEIIKKNEKLSLLNKLWNHLKNKISTFPRYEEFKDIFMYDFKQVLNSAEYSMLINKNPEVINKTELEIYDSHGMVVFLINGLDLMVSPEFDKNELSHLRSILWHAQQIARVGNSLGTWKREIKEKDLSSGVIGCAISKKVVDLNDINELDEHDLITKIEDSDVLKYFNEKTIKEKEEINSIKKNVKSVDLDAYMNGLKNMLDFHLACEGYI